MSDICTLFVLLCKRFLRSYIFISKNSLNFRRFCYIFLENYKIERIKSADGV